MTYVSHARNYPINGNAYTALTHARHAAFMEQISANKHALPKEHPIIGLYVNDTHLDTLQAHGKFLTPEEYQGTTFTLRTGTPHNLCDVAHITVTSPQKTIVAVNDRVGLPINPNPILEVFEAYRP